MKKCLHIIIIILTMFSLTSCNRSLIPNAQEIEDLEFVKVLAFDKSESDPDKIMATIVSRKENGGKKESGNGGSGENGAQGVIHSSEGIMVLQIIKNFQTYIRKQLFFGHTEFVLIGEEAAKEDIIKYLDFVTRDHSFRFNIRVYIVKGISAKSLLEQVNTGDTFISDYLENMVKNSRLTSVTDEIELVDVVSQLDKAYSAAFIPAISLIEEEKTQGEKGRSVNNIQQLGYAVLKHGKLKAYTSAKESEGFKFINNRIGSGSIEVEYPPGKHVALEIIDQNTKIIPQFEENIPSILIKARVSVNINTIHSTENIFTQADINNISNLLSAEVKSDMEKTIEKAKENNTDFLGISEKIYHSNPVRWLSIKDSWDRIFPKLNIIVSVESKINRSYEIKEPNSYGAGERQ